MKIPTLLLKLLGRDAHVDSDPVARGARELERRQADAARRLAAVEAQARAVARR